MAKGAHLCRRAAKVDGNQREIVKALRGAGAYVESFGPVDLLVAYGGLWHVLEIKDGTKPPSQRQLTKREIQWILECRNRAPIHLVTSADEALRAVEAR